MTSSEEDISSCSLSTDVWVLTHRKGTCRVLLHVSAAWSWRQHHDSDRCAAVFIISFVSTVLLSLRHVANIVSWLLHVLTHAGVRYRTHHGITEVRCPPLNFFLSQYNSVHILIDYFSKTCFWYTSWFLKWSTSLRFCNRIFVFICSLLTFSSLSSWSCSIRQRSHLSEPANFPCQVVSHRSKYF
jgi:hypothetical protein